jgi:hypothetical protein
LKAYVQNQNFIFSQKDLLKTNTNATLREVLIHPDKDDGNVERLGSDFKLKLPSALIIYIKHSSIRKTQLKEKCDSGFFGFT